MGGRRRRRTRASSRPRSGSRTSSTRPSPKNLTRPIWNSPGSTKTRPIRRAWRPCSKAASSSARVTLNEMRDALGLEPYANAAADRPMVRTATGYVPIEANAGGEETGSGEESASKVIGGSPAAGTSAQTAPVVVQKYNPHQPRVPAGSQSSGR